MVQPASYLIGLIIGITIMDVDWSWAAAVIIPGQPAVNLPCCCCVARCCDIILHCHLSCHINDARLAHQHWSRVSCDPHIVKPLVWCCYAVTACRNETWWKSNLKAATTLKAVNWGRKTDNGGRCRSRIWFVSVLALADYTPLSRIVRCTRKTESVPVTGRLSIV